MANDQRKTTDQYFKLYVEGNQKTDNVIVNILKPITGYYFVEETG